ncbi:MAG TPA: YCF48-related protein [Bacteroidota bacterium]|nr:YCF48-related protein [Bacteroidota bacterium]
MRLPNKLGIPLVAGMVFFAGCSKEQPDEPHANQKPKTFVWLFPDSTIAEGNSRQRIRWWGEDADGVVKGFLVASGKFEISGQLPDTLAWTWTTKNDSLIAFPLLVRQDTFNLAVRSVDNTFEERLPDQAIVRLGIPAYWDKDGDGQFDGDDQTLPTLYGALDTKSASLSLPILNQPPSVVFAQNPNDPSSIMRQPETTYTAAAFSWIGADPDGDQTIARYEIALNDPNDSSRWFNIPGNIRLVTLSVPRLRSDTASVEADADVYSGTYASTRLFLGTISHLLLNSTNALYVRARDIAGDASPIISMPQSTGNWFVKKPRGKLLIVTDYVASDSVSALSFYAAYFSDPQFAGGKFANFDVLNIGRGLNAQAKRENKIGSLVPPFIDPALISTLHLYDVVVWYTDQFPSLGVAQYPLFQYVRDASHRGRVIFSTTFETSSDPRGALKDFAPIDSVSGVSLASGRLLPTLGDTRIPIDFLLVHDPEEAPGLYPPLKFGGTIPPQVNYSIFMRPIYRRPDAAYIYSVQEDSRVPKRYVFSPVISDLRSVVSVSTYSWACGDGGVILRTSDAGNTWSHLKSGTTLALSAMKFFDQSSGFVVGEDGAILRTGDGGETWTNRSVVTFQDLLGVDFSSELHGIVVGTSGLLIRTTNGGTSWNSPNSHTENSIRSVDLYDENLGIAVGDSGLTVKTTDGGASWNLIPRVTVRHLNAVRFVDNSVAYAVGAVGTVLRSTDAGNSWVVYGGFTTNELRSLFFLDGNTGWTAGTNGMIFQTTNAGVTWLPQPSGITFTTSNGQPVNGIYFSNNSSGLAVCSAGIILSTADGGASWTPQPKSPLNVGVIDGVGFDGKRSFVFLGLPMHILNGDPANLKSFLEHILLQEFGL